MKQIRHPDTGQILQEYDEPDPLRDAIQELLNDRLIDSGASTATGDRSITALRLASLVCDDRPGPTVKLLAEHKAEVLAVLGNSVHESGPLAPAPRFDRNARVADGEAGLEMPCAARRGRTQEVEGAFLHFCVECGAFGAFGYGVSLRAGRLGRWYCAEHRPGVRP
jgi:hypothetical protein